MSQQKEVKDAIITSVTEQFRALIETNFAAISKAANDSFTDDENQSEPRAKASVAVEWDALANAPRVSVKIGWSAKFKDESEQEVDPLQAKLEIGGDK